MTAIVKKSAVLALSALVAAPVALPALAQSQEAVGEQITVQGQIPSDLSGFPEGPELKGIISARNGELIQVTADDGSTNAFGISEATDIRGSGGFLGLSKREIASQQLLRGVPVTVQTVQWEGGLVAKRIRFKNSDLATAAIVRGGTAQQFANHDSRIEALRGRMGDIDKYNLKGTTSVYFDTGKWQLTPDSQRQLCETASQAGAMDNALLLVVGYTDAVGDEDYNQTLSERRAAKVVNYLQQQCRWAPYRMLTPTGMAESDPAADNQSEAGRAQNRRVSVNILVSKAVDVAMNDVGN